MHNPSKLTIGLHSTIYYIAGNLILHGQRPIMAPVSTRSGYYQSQSDLTVD